MTIAFEMLEDRPGVELVDRIERQRYRMHTPAAVTPTPATTESFRFPVGDAVRITTSAVVLPTVVPVYVRDADGEVVAEVAQFESASVPDGSYSLDLCTRIKTYLRVESAFEVGVDLEETRIEFDEPTELLVGARSRHERPKATVTTTADPRDLMTAVSTFGSALKTTDPERSYPTLRGHPPALELGDSLDIPTGIERPDTGVQIGVPADLASVFVAAPLAYYLGADVVPSPTPRVTTDDGFEYSLTSPDGYERSVERTLKQLFFLDCVTRTEGYYQIDLHERRAIEPHVEFDFEALYDRPLTEQIAAYLSVPYGVVADHVPEWRLTTHIEPAAKNAAQLPFVVDDLAIVRTQQGVDRAKAASAPELSGDFARDEVLTRAASSEAGAPGNDYVEPRAADTLEQAWIGDEIPIGASKLTTDAFENRLDREQTDGDISITVVQNDARMDEERRIADEVYGDRDDLPFDITVRENLTTAELADVLTVRSDFFHYIGHIDRAGFACQDGKFDVSTLDSVGVDTFLLNACNSYHQGLALVEGGAIGGIVTLSEVINDSAVEIGGTIARLLNHGFPLRAALTIARDESVMGGQYIVVGDGGITVTQPAGASPNMLRISNSGGIYEIDITTYVTDQKGLGTVIMPFLYDGEDYYLSSGTIGPFTVSEQDLVRFLNLEEVPVKIAGELYWSTSLDVDDVF